ncbi:unnamed protein product [Peniophora sp. CBMAI 1063]|nr:unnamed protein product [Peniophora sp. CBMAI 1063]
MACFLFAERLTPAANTRAPGGPEHLRKCLEILYRVSQRSDQIQALEDPQFELMAQFCFFQVRCFLIGVCQTAQPSKRSYNINTDVDSPNGTHPLRLLIDFSSAKNRLDSGVPPQYPISDPSVPCLVPLHDASCCQDLRDMQHLPACNMLTMIVHMFHAGQQDRAAVLNDHTLLRFSHLLPQDESVFHSWEKTHLSFGPKLSPSRRFRSLLRDAGLPAGWLQNGANHNDAPPLSRFLTETFKYKGESGKEETVTILEILKSLADRVDLTQAVEEDRLASDDGETFRGMARVRDLFPRHPPRSPVLPGDMDLQNVLVESGGAINHRDTEEGSSPRGSIVAAEPPAGSTTLPTTQQDDAKKRAD